MIDRLYLEDVFDTARWELPDRSWYVLQRRYGLTGLPTTTLDQLVQELGVSRETVRKIEQQSLAKLQRALSSATA